LALSNPMLSNKSLDRSGGCVFCIIIVRHSLNEFAPPGQLKRYALLPCVRKLWSLASSSQY
jgi:hypothetical protein